MHSLLAQIPLILETYTVLSPVSLMFSYFVEPAVGSEFPVRDYFQICTFVKSPWVCKGSSQALASKPRCRSRHAHRIWVVVKTMVLFWVLVIVLHLIFRVPKKGP